jgi:uncharacterized protein YjiS (DUF1127 family)
MEELLENTLIHRRGATTRSWISIFDTLADWIERRRQRHELATLPDHMLKDIGINRMDALREAYKPFWQA